MLSALEQALYHPMGLAAWQIALNCCRARTMDASPHNHRRLPGRWAHAGRSVIGDQSDVKTVEQRRHHQRAYAAVERAIALTLTVEQQPVQRTLRFKQIRDSSCEQTK